MRKFSVIIVASRGLEKVSRQKQLGDCLRSLTAQSYPRDHFEVLVIDSGSLIDGRFFNGFRGELDLKIIGGEVNIGPARGRNLGIKEARHDFLAFTDDDSVVPTDWLRRFDEAYERYPRAAAVGGLTLPPEKIAAENSLARFERNLYLGYLKNGKMEEYISVKRDEHPVFSGNISYRKKALEKAGLFDETYPPIIAGEDGDLKERVLESGGEFVFTPAVVEHRASYTLRRFFFQSLSRGASILKYRREHGLENSPILILARLGVAFFSLPGCLVARKFDLGYALVSWLSLVFRNFGKLYYFRAVVGYRSPRRTPLPRKIKVLFIDHTPFLGGSQLALLRHLNSIDLTRFQAILAVADRHLIEDYIAPSRRAAIRIFEIPLGRLKVLSPRVPLNFLKSALAVFKLVRRTKPDLIVVNTERALDAAFLAVLLTKTPLAVFVRDFEFSKAVLHLVNRQVSKFICVSSSIHEFYFGKNSGGKSIVVYVGTDFAERLEKVGPGTVKSLTEAAGLSGKFVIGFVGRLVDWKGPLILPEIAKLLAAERTLPDWQFVVVGSGSGQKGDVSLALQEKIRSLGLEEKFHLTGFVEDPLPWYRLFSLLLHTSYQPEPFATVVVESLTAAVPVIAVDLGGTKEVIEPGKNGDLVRDEAQEFARVLIDLMKNSERLARLRSGALESSKRFRESEITKQIEDIYREVVGDDNGLRDYA